MAARCRKLKIRTSSSPKMWSAWEWVKTMASTRGSPKRRACSRRSVGVSTRTTPSPISSFSPGRQRLFFGFGDWQTRHVQPITGIPVDVPLPSMVTRRAMRWGSLPQPLHRPAPEPGVEQPHLAAGDPPDAGLVEVAEQEHVVALGEPPGDVADQEPCQGALRERPPEPVPPVAVVDPVAVDGQVADAAHLEGSLQCHAVEGVGVGAAGEEEVAV